MFLLSLAAFASAASLRATDPLLPLIAHEYGVTTGAAAGAVTAFALSYGLLQLLVGPLGDRFGRYRTIAAAALVSAFGSAACAVAPSLDALVLARFVSGGMIGAFIPLSLAWIGDTVAYEKRQPMLARFLVGQMAGLAFGTAAAGWLGEHFGWRAIFHALGALLLAIALLLFLELRTQPPAGGGRGTMRRSFARMPRLLASARLRALFATAFAEGVLISGPFAFIAVALQDRFAIGPGLSGTLVAAFAGGGLVYALFARRAVRRLGERGMVTAGGAALAAGYGTLALAGNATIGTVAVALVGAGFYMFHTTVQTHITQGKAEDRGSAVALFAGSLFLGQSAGVWLAGRVLDVAGAVPVFIAAAAGLVVLAALFRYFLSAGGT